MKCSKAMLIAVVNIYAPPEQIVDPSCLAFRCGCEKKGTALVFPQCVV